MKLSESDGGSRTILGHFRPVDHELIDALDWVKGSGMIILRRLTRACRSSRIYGGSIHEDFEVVLLARAIQIEHICR